MSHGSPMILEDQRLDVSMESSRHSRYQHPDLQGSDVPGVQTGSDETSQWQLRSSDLHTFRIDPKVAQDDSAPKFKRLQHVSL